MADKLARTGNYDKQTTAQKASNSAEIFGRKMGSKLKDQALGLVGLEGHLHARHRQLRRLVGPAVRRRRRRRRDGHALHGRQAGTVGDLQRRGVRSRRRVGFARGRTGHRRRRGRRPAGAQGHDR